MKFFPNKLERFLFFFLLFSIPFQTRKILYYSGWRFNEWQTVSVYFTDVLFATLFLFWVYNNFFSSTPKLKIKNEKLKITIKNLKVYDYFLFIFLIISAVSIKNSSNVLVSWFEWLKLLEFAVFFFYLKNYAVSKFGFTNAAFAVFYGGLFQGIIAIAQFLKQSSLGLAYLGESVFSLDMKGVASFYDLYGDKVIRAYGTTPHPNVLAAYLFLSIFCFYFLFLYGKSKNEKFIFYSHLLILWGFFCTFARVAAFALGANYIVRTTISLFIFPHSLQKDKLSKIVWFTMAVVMIFIVLYWPAVVSRVGISGEEDAVRLRGFYNRESLNIISWTGTGIGDFVNELAARVPMLSSYLYQPVHNLYLLIYSETGVLGISSFVMFLIFLIKNFVVRTKMERFHHYSLMLFFSSFLFMGLFDHFLWTIQQGRFIFWLVLAALAVKENDDIG